MEICIEEQISTIWASILARYSTADLSIYFGSDFAPAVAATSALALAVRQIRRPEYDIRDLDGLFGDRYRGGGSDPRRGVGEHRVVFF